MMEQKDLDEYHNLGKNLKVINKYNYKQYTRTTDRGRRVYLDGKAKLPSVTTILSKTKVESDGIKAWRERVGDAEAKRIMKEAADRGSVMHEMLERYVHTNNFDTPAHDAPIAHKMAKLIISKGFIYLDEVWGIEQNIAYPEEYAGTIDCVGLYKKKPTILDFKQTNKPKREEWVEDYYLQLAAYICAHEKQYGEINGGTILMASTGLVFQEFELSGSKLSEYKDKWWQRVEDFKTNHALPPQVSSQKV
jgi:hypothetical protein